MFGLTNHKPLNILKIYYNPRQNVGNVYLDKNLIRSLAKRGHEIILVNYGADDIIDEYDNVQIHNLGHMQDRPVKNTPDAYVATEIMKLSEKTPIDVIHTDYTLKDGGIAINAREMINRSCQREHRVAIVMSSHGTDVFSKEEDHIIVPAIESRLNQADDITFASKYLQKYMMEKFSLHNYGRVTYPLIDFESFKNVEGKDAEEVRKRLKIPDDNVVFYHVSCLRPIKNTNIIIDSINYLIKNGRKKVHLMIIGDGPERKNLEKQVNDYGIGDYITFVGNLGGKELPTYMKAGHVHVLSSGKESFPKANLESMYLGNPVISSNVGGVHEAIKHGENGFLFNLEETGSCAKYMKMLVENPNLIRKLGKTSQEIVNRYFTPDKMLGQYEELYFETLDKVKI